MKRFTLTAIALTATLSSFAYYGSYSSEPSGWLTFLCLIMFVWGVLEIILFFKIWGMTNDIKALKEDYFTRKKKNGDISESQQKEECAQTARDIRLNFVQGNIENIKKILIENFIYTVEREYSKMKPYSLEKGKNGELGWVSHKEQNLNNSIKPYIEQLVTLYAKFGETVPACITRLETFGDYYKLFDVSDLVVKGEKETKEKP